jgi:hypothetical protein
MDRVSPTSPVERVVFIEATQLGAAEMGSNWIGYGPSPAPLGARCDDVFRPAPVAQVSAPLADKGLHGRLEASAKVLPPPVVREVVLNTSLPRTGRQNALRGK